MHCYNFYKHPNIHNISIFCLHLFYFQCIPRQCIWNSTIFKWLLNRRDRIQCEFSITTTVRFNFFLFVQSCIFTILIRCMHEELSYWIIIIIIITITIVIIIAIVAIISITFITIMITTITSFIFFMVSLNLIWLI